MEALLKTILPKKLKTQIRRSLLRVLRSAFGLETYPGPAYYSPLITSEQLETNASRWNRPTKLLGIGFDNESMKKTLAGYASDYVIEFSQLPPYEDNIKKEFGPGYPLVDSFLLYAFLRRLQPKQYLEVGSGLSTYYSSLARDKNLLLNGRGCNITCIEPFPYEALRRLPDVRLIINEVQDVAPFIFMELEENDVLFIDSSHVIRLDGDVPYLHLEILPELKKGVVVHIHDIPFPYITPFPAEYWVFKQEYPRLWNEAMLVHAFLQYNECFEIMMSVPLLRFYDESFLRATLPFYHLSRGANTPSSLWLRKIC